MHSHVTSITSSGLTATIFDSGTLDTGVTIECENCDYFSDEFVMWEPECECEQDACANGCHICERYEDAMTYAIDTDDHECESDCEGHTTNTPYETIYCDGSCRS